MSGLARSGRNLVTSTGGLPLTDGPVGFQIPSPGSGCGKTGLIGGGKTAAFARAVTCAIVGAIAPSPPVPTARVRGATWAAALFAAVVFDPPPHPTTTPAAATPAMSPMRLL